GWMGSPSAVAKSPIRLRIEAIGLRFFKMVLRRLASAMRVSSSLGESAVKSIAIKTDSGLEKENASLQARMIMEAAHARPRTSQAGIIPRVFPDYPGAPFIVRPAA